jgi:hypothetical protein
MRLNSSINVDLGVRRGRQQRRPQLPQGRHLRDCSALNDTVLQADEGAHRSCDEGTHDGCTDDGHADVQPCTLSDPKADAGAAFTNTDTDLCPASHAHVVGAVAPTHTLCSITSTELRAISKAHYVNM